MEHDMRGILLHLSSEIEHGAEQELWGEGFDPEFPPLDEDTPLSQLVAYDRVASAIIAAARKQQAVIRDRIGAQLNGQSYRDGDMVYRNRPEVTYKVIDSEALWDFLGNDARAVVRIDSGNIRRTALRAAAAKKSLDVNAVFDTFFEKIEKANKVNVLPVDRATKREQALEDGELG